MKKHLVMLHGFGCDSRIFTSMASKLSKEHDAMMVDLPGHGQTREKFVDFSFCAYTLLHVLDEYIGTPYSLLGWSMGGQIALEMIRQDPKPIQSLILLSTTPKFVESKAFKIGMNRAMFNKFKKGIKDDVSKTMNGFYDLIFSKGEDTSKYIPDLKSQVPSPQTLLACMESFEKYDKRDVLPSISVPTLIICGDSDRVIDPKASLYMSQEIKGSIIKVFHGAGHAPHLTRETEVIDELSRFL